MFGLFKKKSDRVRLVLSETSYREPCTDCMQDAELGWMPASKIRMIGERECGQSCTCTLEFEREFSTADNAHYAESVRSENPEFFGLTDSLKSFLKGNR